LRRHHEQKSDLKPTSAFRLDLTLDPTADTTPNTTAPRGGGRRLKAELSAALLRDMKLAVGTTVSVVLPAEQLWAFPA